MVTREYRWNASDGEHQLALAAVQGTENEPFMFGHGEHGRAIDVEDFCIGVTPVTQALWQHVMGENPSREPHPRWPVTQVSWDHISEPGGFLDRINASPIRRVLGNDSLVFRLPTEVEWEYAARGGPHWREGYRFSVSNDPDAVAWHGPRWNRLHEALMRTFGWPLGWRVANYVQKLTPRVPSHPHDVATKLPNQLGLHDMSGNVWEWCESYGPGSASDPADRPLRGGSHQNWDLHCTAFWRYGIVADAHDECLGFRIVLAPPC